MSIRSELLGCGSYLPEKVLTNDDLSLMVETNDEWIRTRTGILSRHIAQDETVSDMVIKASEKAIKNAGISAQDIDLVIVATITPDKTTPSTAAIVAAALDLPKGTPVFDISAACSGFVYALTMADNMIRLAQARCALIVGAETLSKITDWTDRNTCVLFGDGAGAAILRASEGTGETADHGVLATKLYADGHYWNELYTTGGVSSTQESGYLRMNGKEVFKFAVDALTQAAANVMETAGVTVEDVDWVISHQANSRIIESVGHKLKVPSEKLIITLDHQGNTSAASIPLALSESIENGRIKKGDLVVLTAMGAGFTWGGALIRI